MVTSGVLLSRWIITLSPLSNVFLLKEIITQKRTSRLNIVLYIKKCFFHPHSSPWPRVLTQHSINVWHPQNLRPTLIFFWHLAHILPPPVSPDNASYATSLSRILHWLSEDSHVFYVRISNKRGNNKTHGAWLKVCIPMLWGIVWNCAVGFPAKRPLNGAHLSCWGRTAVGSSVFPRHILLAIRVGRVRIGTGLEVGGQCVCCRQKVFFLIFSFG